jgi:hypothetical protein
MIAIGAANKIISEIHIKNGKHPDFKIPTKL